MYGVTWSTEEGGSFHQTGYDYATVDEARRAAHRCDFSDKAGSMPGERPGSRQVWAAIETEADVVERIAVYQDVKELQRYEVGVVYYFWAEDEEHACEQFAEAEPECADHINHVGKIRT